MRIAIDARCLTGAYTGDRTYWLGLLKALILQERGKAGTRGRGEWERRGGEEEEYGRMEGWKDGRLEERAAGSRQQAADNKKPKTKNEKRNSKPEFLLFTDQPLPSGILPPADCWREMIIPARSGRWWSLFTLPLAAHRAHADVVHVQYTVSPLFRQPVVTTVHDISFFVEPRWFRLKDRLLLRWLVPASCRRAARVITVSETSREDILRYLRLPPEKVVATPLGLPEGFHPLPKAEAQAWVRAQYGVEPPYWLAVGVLQPRKNWSLAILAVALAREQTQLPLRLLLTGKPGWAGQELAEMKTDLEAESWLIETGYVPDEHLPYLYNASEALLYPSYYEGFGLPPLEAMACGTPVIVSNGGALPEVVGEGGIILPPDEPGLWAQAILTVLENPDYAEQLRARALKRAACFSWQETAKKTMEVYQAVGSRQ